MENLLGEMLVSGLIGALIGGGTNAIAIKALFRPLHRAWWGWQGIIPKNQDKLARNISRVVDEDLLNQASLLARLDSPQFNEWLRQAVGHQIERLAAASPSDLYEKLPAEWRQRRLRRLLRRVVLMGWRWLESPQGEAWRRRLVDDLEARLQATRLDDIVGPAAAAELTDEAAAFFFSPKSQAYLEAYVHDKLVALLTTKEPLRSLLPGDVQQLLNDALKRSLPTLLERFAQWASQPENIDALHDVLIDKIEELDSLKRLIGKGALRLFEREFAALKERIPHYFSTYLDRPEVRAEVEERITGVVDDTLDMPVARIVGDRAEGLANSIGGVVGLWLGSPEMKEKFGQFLRQRYTEYAGRDIRSLLPDGLWAALTRPLVDLPVDGVRQRRWTRQACDWIESRLRSQQTPLGRYLGTPASRGRLADHLAAVVGGLLRRRAPDLIARFDVRAVIYQQVMRFDLHKVERMVKDLIDRELGAIVELGIGIGLLVGALMPLLHWAAAAVDGALWVLVGLGYAWVGWRLVRFARALRRG